LCSQFLKSLVFILIPFLPKYSFASNKCVAGTIVSPIHLLEAKEYLKKCGLKIKTKLFKNCEHNIPVEGTSLGLAFLKKNIL